MLSERCPQFFEIFKRHVLSSLQEKYHSGDHVTSADDNDDDENSGAPDANSVPDSPASAPSRHNPRTQSEAAAF